MREDNQLWNCRIYASEEFEIGCDDRSILDMNEPDQRICIPKLTLGDILVGKLLLCCRFALVVSRRIDECDLVCSFFREAGILDRDIIDKASKCNLVFVIEFMGQRLHRIHIQ